MPEQKRKLAVEPGVLAAVLLMALAVSLLVLLGIGLLVSAMVVRGWAGTDALGWMALGALFVAALTGGVFACRKLRTMPLVWGVCVGGALALVCLAAGVLSYGAGNAGGIGQRTAAALLGGALAGVLSALRRR